MFAFIIYSFCKILLYLVNFKFHSYSVHYFISCVPIKLHFENLILSFVLTLYFVVCTYARTNKNAKLYHARIKRGLNMYIHNTQGIWGVWMVQRWERSSPTDVSWVRFRPGIICGLILSMVLTLLQEFFSGFFGFAPFTKPNISKFQFD